MADAAPSPVVLSLERVARSIDTLFLAGWILGLDPGSGCEYRDVAVLTSLEDAQTCAVAAESAQLEWRPGPVPFAGLTAVGGLGVWVVDYRAEALVIYQGRAMMKARERAWTQRRAAKTERNLK